MKVNSPAFSPTTRYLPFMPGDTRQTASSTSGLQSSPGAAANRCVTCGYLSCSQAADVPGMCSCKVTSGFHCSRCCLTFTSLTAFDRHLGKLIPGLAYSHQRPEDCGL